MVILGIVYSWFTTLPQNPLTLPIAMECLPILWTNPTASPLRPWLSPGSSLLEGATPQKGAHPATQKLVEVIRALAPPGENKKNIRTARRKISTVRVENLGLTVAEARFWTI